MPGLEKSNLDKVPLSVSDTLYRSTIDAMEEAVHVVGKDLRIVLCNKTFRHWIKKLKTDSKIIGEDIFEIQPFLPKELRNEYKRVFKTGKPLCTQEATKVNDDELITETRKIPVFEGKEIVRIVTVVRDVTKEKRSEKELRRYHKQLENIVKKRTAELEKELAERRKAEESLAIFYKFSEESGQALGMADLKGDIIYANPALRKILEETAESVIGKNVVNFYPDELKKKLQKEILPLVLKKGNWVGEIPLISSKGKITPAIQSIFILHSQKKKPLYFANVITNITERVTADEALQKLSKMNTDILEKAPFGIYVVNSKGRIEYANPAMIEISGDTEEQFKSINVFTLPTYKRLGLSEKIKSCLKGEHFILGPIGYTSYLASKKTARNFFGMPLDQPDGKKALIFVEDITNLRKAEDQSRELKKQIEFILGATKTGLDIIDANYNIRYIDPEWQKVYGDPGGKKCFEYFMDRNRTCPDCGIKQAFKTKKTVVTEEVLVKENNRPIQVITMPYKNEQGEWLVAEVNVDIAERKKAEAQLLAAQERLMRSEKLAIIGQLTGAIGHEFRNQLGIMRNIVYFLKLKSDNLEPKVKKHVNILEKELMETDNMIENILSFGRTRKAVFKKVKLQSLIDSSLKKINAHHATMIKKQYQENLPLVEVDTIMISMVLLNIFNNALQAMEGRYRNENLIEVILKKEQNRVFVSIRDNGCGIEPQYINSVFEPLFTTKASGAGLGLFTCKLLIDVHGGSVNISGKSGKGTTIEFSLPIRQK